MEAKRTIEPYDIVVVGCGMAGLCAGIKAAEEGASVAVLEKAPKSGRGGQTQHAVCLRVPSTDIDLPDSQFKFDTEYSPNDFYQDIMRVTNGRADNDLAHTLVHNAGPTFEWLAELGVNWESERPIPDRNLTATIVGHPGNNGDQLVEELIDIAETHGVDVFYNTEARSLEQGGDVRIDGLIAVSEDDIVRFDCEAVIIAAGGFESNEEKRTKYIGPEFDEIIVRGSRYVTGEAIDMAIDIGANPVGQWSGAHMAIVDPAQAAFGGGRMKINGYTHAVVINHDGERFLDEGKDQQTLTYAKYGREVFEQPYHEAFFIFDSKVKDLVYSSGPTDPIKSNDMQELVTKLGIENVQETLNTIDEFNSACDPNGFNPDELDGNSTEGITPKKSNWALPIDDPPYYGYPGTAGITFTFGGLEINEDAKVFDTRNRPIPGLFAAGNSTGGLYYSNYLGSSGQTNAAVFGKIAGKQAYEYVTSSPTE